MCGRSVLLHALWVASMLWHDPFRVGSAAHAPRHGLPCHAAHTSWPRHAMARPFPAGTAFRYVSLARRCLDSNPAARPLFPEIAAQIEGLLAHCVEMVPGARGGAVPVLPGGAHAGSGGPGGISLLGMPTPTAPIKVPSPRPPRAGVSGHYPA